MQNYDLTLASSSPRRSFYLNQLGFRFRKSHPEVDELPRSGEKPARYVRRLALEKARAVAAKRPSSWIVAADTSVVVDDTVLGKPRNDREAKRMLRILSDRWHQAVSGLSLLRQDQGVELVELSVTRVLFRKMTEGEIRWYVASGEPADKAGAYAIQGKGGLFVQRIVGSPSNVVGFPLEAFYRLLKAAKLGLP